MQWLKTPGQCLAAARSTVAHLLASISAAEQQRLRLAALDDHAPPVVLHHRPSRHADCVGGDGAVLLARVRNPDGAVEALGVDDSAAAGGGPVEDFGSRLLDAHTVAEGAAEGGGGHFGRLGRLCGEAAAAAPGVISAGGALGNGGEVKADNVLVDPSLHPGQRLYKILLQEMHERERGSGRSAANAISARRRGRCAYFGIKSAQEGGEAEDGGGLGGEEGEDGEQEGAAVGVRRGHARPGALRRRAVAPAVPGGGPDVSRRRRGSGGPDVALVDEEAGEHHEGAAEHHA